MEGISKIENNDKVNVVKVLAKAASCQEYYQKLMSDPIGMLYEAGIQGKEFYIPKEQDLKTILYMLECSEGPPDKKRN
jgi:hypothetical protein